MPLFHFSRNFCHTWCMTSVSGRFHTSRPSFLVSTRKFLWKFWCLVDRTPCRDEQPCDHWLCDDQDHSQRNVGNHSRFQIHPRNSHPVRNNQNLHLDFVATLILHGFHHTVVAILSVQCCFYGCFYYFLKPSRRPSRQLRLFNCNLLRIRCATERWVVFESILKPASEQR